MTGSLRVYLTDKDTGNPIANIPVWCAKTNKTTKTSYDGEVQFNDLPCGDIIGYQVNKGGYNGYEELSRDSATVYEGRITVRRHKLNKSDDDDDDDDDDNGGDMQNYWVHVKDEEGNPIDGALVEGRHYSPDSTAFSKTTESNGKAFVFRIDPSTLDHWGISVVSKDGYEPQHGIDCDTTHEYILTLVKRGGNAIGKITKFTMDKTSISPGESFVAGAEVLNDGGVAGKIKLTIGLQTAPPGQASMFDYATKDYTIEPKRIKGFNHTFTLPADYEGDRLYVVALAFHEG